VHGRLVLHQRRADGDEPLDDGFSVADDIAYLVQPRFAIQVRGLDDQRVAVPVAERVALPEPNAVRQVPTSVERHDAPRHPLEEDSDVGWRLHDIERRRYVERPRYAAGKTVSGRVVVATFRSRAADFLLARPRLVRQSTGLRIDEDAASTRRERLVVRLK